MKIYKRPFALGLFFLVPLIIWAQGPNGTGTYYQSTNGKSGATLKTAFFNVIKGTLVSRSSYSNLWNIYKTSDVRSDGKLQDIYSNATNYVIGGTAQGASYSKEGDAYNREHTMPKSWFSDAEPMYHDAYHVMPSDGYVNGRRSNYPYGETTGGTYKSNNGYSKLGNCTLQGYSGIVFEPNDEFKGDLARAYFYMATCYESQIANWSSTGGGTEIFSKDSYKPFVKWQMDMLMRWAKNDPVDAREVKRNEAVATAQANRNPFIDYPGLEDYIWGDSVNVAFSYDHYRQGSTGVDPDPTPQPGNNKVIYEESFATGMGQFSIDNKNLPSGLSSVWSPYSNSTVSCMKGSAFYNKVYYVAESWLVSPVIDLTNYNTATLTVDQVTNYLNGSDANGYLSIKVREANGTWNNLGLNVPAEDKTWTFVTTTKDMTAFAGKKIQIAFVYTSSSSIAPTWELMNLKVEGATTSSIVLPGISERPAGANAPMYNLAGQLVNKSYQGVVIQSGKKFLNRRPNQ